MPRPLPPLLLAVLVLAFAWALLVPPWQAPDETAHFAYAQLLAERFDLPGEEGSILSTELGLAWRSSNASQVAQLPPTRPEWSPEAYERWRAADANLGEPARKDGTGPNPARSNPPLYYLYAAPAYLAASGGDILDRFYLMRLWSALLLVATCLGTWLLAGELFGRERRLLQACSAALVGLQPMESFISSSVTPDGLLFSLWAFAFWLGVRVIRRGLTLVDGAALFGVVALAVLVKGTSYALLPAAALALAVGAWRRRREGTGRMAAIAAAALLAFAVPAGAWFGIARSLDRPAVNQVGGGQERASLSPRSFGSYLWQYYFPRLPSQKKFPVIEDLRVYDVWVKTGWGAFGSLEVRFPAWVYRVLAAISALFLVAGAVALIRRRAALDPAVVGFLGLAAFVLVLGLHWVEYRTVIESQLPFAQGRYLLPLLPLYGVGVAGLLAQLPRRGEAVGVGLVLGAALTLQLFSLGVVAERYFA